jgi:transposase
MDPQTIRRSVSQSLCSRVASSARFLGAASAQAPGASRSRRAGYLDARATSGHQKKAARCRGVVLFEDEASFWLDGTLHRTWSRVGVQPRVDTYGQRKTAHVFGAVSLNEVDFTFQFSPVFNGRTFLEFLKLLVAKYTPWKIFLIMDNGPCHNLDAEGVAWLRANRRKIALYRLPPYSPEFNPMEPVWKVTRKMTTHNRFYATTAERDAALTATFRKFQRRPELIAGNLARFQ